MKICFEQLIDYLLSIEHMTENAFSSIGKNLRSQGSARSLKMFFFVNSNNFVKLNDMNLTNTRTTLFVVGRQLSTSDSTQAPNFEAPMSYKQK